jgi:hypothetical protein
MDAVETVKAKLKRIVPNKGDMMLFIVAYFVWIAATTWIFWQPLPSARTQPDIFGTPRVVACLTVIANYVKCAMFMDLLTATIAIILRASVIFLLPLLLFLIGAAIFRRVGDSHGKIPPTSPN